MLPGCENRAAFTVRIPMIANAFAQALASFLEQSFTSARLLEVALNYNLPMWTGFALIAKLKSLDAASSSEKAESMDADSWDDGLQCLR